MFKLITRDRETALRARPTPMFFSVELLEVLLLCVGQSLHHPSIPHGYYLQWQQLHPTTGFQWWNLKHTAWRCCKNLFGTSTCVWLFHGGGGIWSGFKFNICMLPYGAPPVFQYLKRSGREIVTICKARRRILNVLEVILHYTRQGKG